MSTQTYGDTRKCFYSKNVREIHRQPKRGVGGDCQTEIGDEGLLT